MRRSLLTAVFVMVAAGCGPGEGTDAGTAGGRAGGVAGGSSGGTSGGVAGGTAGGTSGGVAGGTAGGVAGGTSGGVAGGSSGGVAGGTAGGSSGGVAGGSSGGVAGGSSGGAAGGMSGGVAGGSSGGVAGGTSGGIAGGMAGGDAGVPDAGCGCGSRQCLGDGGCADCLSDQHCPSATPVCDSSNRCVQCRVSNDGCDAGTYCTTAGSCVRGCKRPSDCRSGLCTAAHDCITCQSDSECDVSRSCGSGVCSAPCVTASTCTPGWSCCGSRCVDITRDPAHCGGCVQPCDGDRFCGASSCRDGVLSSVCTMSQATALLDGRDDDAGLVLGQALSGTCTPVVTVSAVPQLDSGVLATDGEPLLTGSLLCVAGGSFFQRSINWLETNGVAHVTDTSTTTQYRLTIRDGGIAAMGAMSTLSPTHDVFVLQLVRAPSGAVVLNSGGFFAEGTVAGAWYFQNVLMPMRASLSSPWYVYEWTDTTGNGPDMSDTFTRLAP